MTDEKKVQDDVLPAMAHDGIHAGFPSPATDYMQQAIDLKIGRASCRERV